MHRYLKIYSLLLKMNFANLLIYKGHFINSVISSIGWGTFSIISIVLLTSRTSTVFGWTQQELLILTAVLNIVLGIFRSLFSKNFNDFSQMAYRGEFDQIITKPVDAQFIISFRYVNFAGVFRILLSTVLLMYLLFHNNIHVGIVDSFGFLIFMTAGMIILYSIWYTLITFTIWSPMAANINELMYSIDGVIRYPQEMFKGFGEFIFFILFPLTLVIVFPTKILLHKFTVLDGIVMIIVTTACFCISRYFFRYALRYYASASS